MADPQPKYTCKGPRVLPPADANPATHERLILSDLRIACGADITALVNAVAQDGLDHVIECPKCGTTARIMRTPPNG